MKKILLLTVISFTLCFLCCKKVNTKIQVFKISDISENERLRLEKTVETFFIDIQPVDSAKVSPYSNENIVGKSYNFKSDNIRDYLYTVLIKDTSIDSISYNQNEDQLILFATQNSERDFFADAKYSWLAWKYFYFHTIYSSFFHYDEIRELKLVVNNNVVTSIPFIGDYDYILPPDGFMKKEWYVDNIDYLEYFDPDNPKSYQNFEEHILSVETLVKIVEKHN